MLITPEISLYINSLNRIPIWIMVAGLDIKYEHTFFHSRDEFQLAIEGKLPHTEKVEVAPPGIQIEELVKLEIIRATAELASGGIEQVCRKLHNPLLQNTQIENPRNGEKLGRNWHFLMDVVRSTLVTGVPTIVVERSRLKNGYFADIEFLYQDPSGFFERQNDLLFNDKFQADSQIEIEIMVRARLKEIIFKLLNRISDSEIIFSPNRRIGDQIWEILVSL